MADYFSMNAALHCELLFRQLPKTAFEIEYVCQTHPLIQDEERSKGIDSKGKISFAGDKPAGLRASLSLFASAFTLQIFSGKRWVKRRCAAEKDYENMPRPDSQRRR